MERRQKQGCSKKLISGLIQRRCVLVEEENKVTEIMAKRENNCPTQKRSCLTENQDNYASRKLFGI